MNCHELARVARIQRDRPGWSRDACIQRAEDEADEYAAEEHPTSLLGASDE